MLRDKRWNAPDVGSERAESRGRLLVVQLDGVEFFCGSTQSTAQAIKRQFTLRQDLPSFLKFTERIEHQTRGVNLDTCSFLFKKCWLAHDYRMCIRSPNIFREG